MKDTGFCAKLCLESKGILKEFNRPVVMGILNITPDSFYATSRVNSVQDALLRAEAMIREGADMLDVGGYSSRPGADDISEQTEIERVVPVIEALNTNFPGTLLSIDTFRSTVAEKALNAGAHVINDISGGQLDPVIFNVAARWRVPLILMHMRGTPQTMQGLTNYADVLSEVRDFLKQQAEKAVSAGVRQVILDPGFGFSKTLDQNYTLLRNLHQLSSLDLPILVGVSRKSMIYKKLGIEADLSLNGTTVLNTIALLKGASILRVHDVREARQAIELVQASIT